MIRNNVHRCHFVLLFPLHSPVLEPDLDLSLGEAEGVSNLNSSSTSQVAVEVELFLQFQRLVASVRGALSLCFAVCVHGTFKMERIGT